MNARDHPVVDDTAGLPSLTALRATHIALLERRRAEGDTPALLATLADFVKRGVATGVLIDADVDRQAAQSLLDYWANTLHRAGVEPPDAILADFDLDLAPELNDSLCPYLGLDAFTEANQKLFFGRQHLIDELVVKLRASRIIFVVGPSGSGKSSLVRAGLLPALRAGALPGSQGWRYCQPMVPGSDPLASLDRALQTEHQELTAEPQGPGTGGERSVLDAPVRNSTLVLVVDQFEEVFTLCDSDTARGAFVDRLLNLIQEPNVENRLILTLRSDFENYIVRLPQLQALFASNQVRVPALSASELREAIEQPAAQVGLKFEDGVVDALIQDILGEPAALPLLQFTLLKLWEQRDHNRITWDAYRQLGGARQALAHSADIFYANLIPQHQVTARRILLRMVRPSEGLEVTSNRIRRESLYRGAESHEWVDAVLDKLVEARLVRLTRGDTPTDDQIEVAHEALVRNWPRLVAWLEEERVALRRRLHLTAAAQQWDALGRDPSALFSGPLLDEALRYDDLSDLEAEFVHASQATIKRMAQEKEAAQQRELAQARALAKTERRLTIALGVLLIIVLAAAVYAAILRNQALEKSYLAQTAQANAQTAQANAQTAQATAELLANARAVQAATAHAAEQTAIAAQIETDHLQQNTMALFFANQIRAVIDRDPDLALLIAIAGAERVRAGTLRDTEGRVVESLKLVLSSIVSRVVLREHNGAVRSVMWSYDGRRVVTAGDDNQVIVRDAQTGVVLEKLEGHKEGVLSARWSPDPADKYILTASRDGTARVWDSTTGKQLAVLPDHRNIVRRAEWSPDGHFILTVGNDWSARIWVWDAQTNTFTRGPVLHHNSFVSSGVWSQDGRSILTACDDGIARIWSMPKSADWASTRRPNIRTFEGHTAPLTSVIFSPNGRFIVTTSADSTARVWDATTGQQKAIYAKHTAVVSSAAWSPDSNRIITAAGNPRPDALLDKTAQIWSSDGSTLEVLEGHTAGITDVAWRPDGQFIATSSGDNTVIIWDPTVDSPLHILSPKHILRGHNASVLSVMWSPDGQSLLTGSDDNTARIWDIPHGQLPEQLDELIALAKSRVKRQPLNKEEQQRYLPPESSRPPDATPTPAKAP